MYITTKVVSSTPVHGEISSIQHYVIKFVSDFRQVWFSPVSSNNKTDRHEITELLLKVTLKTIKLNQTSKVYNLKLNSIIYLNLLFNTSKDLSTGFLVSQWKLLFRCSCKLAEFINGVIDHFSMHSLNLRVANRLSLS